MSSLREIAKLFALSRVKGIPITLPATLSSVQEAYRLQNEIINLGDTDNPLGKFVGWKIGATNAAVQSKLGFGPFYGPLFEKTVTKSECSVSIKSMGPLFRAAESEIAFRIKENLPPRKYGPHTVISILSSLSYVHPAIELACGRVLKSTPHGIVADFASNGLNIVGSPVSLHGSPEDVIARLAAVEVSILVNGRVEVSGSGSDVMGNPLVALTWLANTLNDSGQMLLKDQIVLTGAMAIYTTLEGGEILSMDFNGLRGDSAANSCDSVHVHLLR